MSVNSVLTSLADAIRSKTGGTDTMTLEEMTAAVNGLNASGLDTSDATATATDMVKGKTAYVNGEKVIGTMEQYKNGQFTEVDFSNGNVLITKTPTGNYYVKQDEAFLLYGSGELFGDATAEDVAKGKTFTSADGLKIEGTAESSDSGSGSAVPSAEGVEF